MASRMNPWIIALLVLGVILLVAFAAAGYVVSTRNNMVTLQAQYQTAWAQVENQLQRRNDLIPNYVETVKGYAKQETTIFTAIANARARIGGAGPISDKIAASNEMSNALSRLLVVVENYPQLRSSENFMQLQDELAGTENRIAVERMRYNDAVMAYNVGIRRFPANIIAGMFNFGPAPLFQAPAAAHEAPKVNFTTPDTAAAAH